MSSFAARAGAWPDCSPRTALRAAPPKGHAPWGGPAACSPRTALRAAPPKGHAPWGGPAARFVAIALALLFSVVGATPAQAFCGFFVGKADAGLFNDASQVILVRRDNRTVISMANDYRGELTDFALVVPVPTVLERGQIRIGDRKLFERIDSYSAPRLAEYFDPDPCRVARSDALRMQAPLPASAGVARETRRDQALGVTVEASYTVGEYDIVILSGKAYAIVVAIAAFLWHFALFKTNGLVWALFLCTPLVPLIDRLWPAEKFEWRQRAQIA